MNPDARINELKEGLRKQALDFMRLAREYNSLQAAGNTLIAWRTRLIGAESVDHLIESLGLALDVKARTKVRHWLGER